MIRVGVAGAAGRMGAAACAAVEAAPDMELRGPRRPGARRRRSQTILGDCDVVVDFTAAATRRSRTRARASPPACTS